MEQQDHEAMMCEMVVNRALDFVGALSREDAQTPPSAKKQGRQRHAEQGYVSQVPAHQALPHPRFTESSTVAPQRWGHDDSSSSIERTPGPHAKQREKQQPLPGEEDEDMDEESEQLRKLRGEKEAERSGAWVMVSRLDAATTDESLLSLFFPYGADKAFLAKDPDSKLRILGSGVSGAPDKRKTGFVQFPSEVHAALAVSKLNHFIPCHQSQALIVVRCAPPSTELVEAKHEAEESGQPENEEHSEAPESGAGEQLQLLLTLSSTTPAQIAGFIEAVGYSLSPSAVIDATLSSHGACREPATWDLNESEPKDATPTKIRRDEELETQMIKMASALALVRSEMKKELQVAIVRQLLSIILMGNDSSTPPEDQGEQRKVQRTAEESMKRAPRCINAGVFLGLLFASGFVVGDANCVGSKLLKSELTEPFQILAIAQLVRCGSGGFATPSSSPPQSANASFSKDHDSSDVMRKAPSWYLFWQQLSELSELHPLEPVRSAAAREVNQQKPFEFHGWRPTQAALHNPNTPPRFVPIKVTTTTNSGAMKTTTTAFPATGMPPWGFVPYPHPQFSQSAGSTGSPKAGSTATTSLGGNGEKRQLSPLARPFVSALSAASPPSQIPQSQFPFGPGPAQNRSPSPPDYNLWSSVPPTAFAPLSASSPLSSNRPPALGGSPTMNSPTSSILSPLGARRAEEARHRTVYISRLSPMCPQATLRNLLNECGPVNKVRICHEKGYATLFGFVEMKTPEGAANLIGKDRTDVAGGAARFQPAKSAVLDVEASDAVEGADGTILKPCAYGLSAPGILVSQGKEFKAK